MTHVFKTIDISCKMLSITSRSSTNLLLDTFAKNAGNTASLSANDSQRAKNDSADVLNNIFFYFFSQIYLLWYMILSSVVRRERELKTIIGIVFGSI